MANFDRRNHLKRLHEEKRGKTCQKVDNAIKRLIKANKTINFNSIAAEAGISKATLYNNKDIRERIESLRSNEASQPSLLQRKREVDENNKDAIISSLKRKIKKLEEENKRLNEQMKVVYGDLYKKL